VEHWRTRSKVTACSFERVHLLAKENRNFILNIAPEELAVWTNHSFVINPGMLHFLHLMWLKLNSINWLLMMLWIAIVHDSILSIGSWTCLIIQQIYTFLYNIMLWLSLFPTSKHKLNIVYFYFNQEPYLEYWIIFIHRQNTTSRRRTATISKDSSSIQYNFKSVWNYKSFTSLIVFYR